MRKFETLTFILVFAFLSLAVCTVKNPTKVTSKKDSLQNTRWVLAAYGKSSPISGTTLTAEFIDGMVRGSAGCNWFGAPYRVSGEEILISDVEITAEACQEPYGVMEQEQDFIEILLGAKSFQLIDNHLSIFRTEEEMLEFILLD